MSISLAGLSIFLQKDGQTCKVFGFKALKLCFPAKFSNDLWLTLYRPNNWRGYSNVVDMLVVPNIIVESVYKKISPSKQCEHALKQHWCIFILSCVKKNEEKTYCEFIWPIWWCLVFICSLQPVACGWSFYSYRYSSLEVPGWPSCVFHGGCSKEQRKTIIFGGYQNQQQEKYYYKFDNSLLVGLWSNIFKDMGNSQLELVCNGSDPGIILSFEHLFGASQIQITCRRRHEYYEPHACVPWCLNVHFILF